MIQWNWISSQNWKMPWKLNKTERLIHEYLFICMYVGSYVYKYLCIQDAPDLGVKPKPGDSDLLTALKKN